jgi:hypothetical protein
MHLKKLGIFWEVITIGKVVVCEAAEDNFHHSIFFMC